MTRRWIVSALAVLTWLALTAPAHAAGNANAKILVHLMTPTTKNPCTRSGVTPACSGITTAGLLYPNSYFAYLLVADGNAASGISGAQFGLDYDGVAHSGVDVYSWTLCTDVEFPMTGWPGSGSGNLVTWDPASHCQRTEPGGSGSGVVAVLGYLYVGAYSPDRLSVVPRPADGYAKVSDCLGAETVLAGGGINPTLGPLGYAEFSAGGSTPGYNPCGQNTVPPDCLISGPSSVTTGTSGIVFTVDSTTPGASFAWTVSGHGSIVGPATGPSVTVDAGQAGYFLLNVDVAAGTGSGNCSKSVSVIAPPGCSINGPSQVVDSWVYTYTITTEAPPPVSYEWSIAGGGTLATSNNDTARVTATMVTGSWLTLTVRTTGSDGMTSVCSKGVTVLANTAALKITGPELVVEGALSSFQATNFNPGLPISWSVLGNGTIEGSSTSPAVTVRAGTTGYYRLTLTNGQQSDNLIVNVNRYIPRPAANSDAKILVHLTPPVTSGACGSRSRPRCNQVTSSGSLWPATYYAYVVVAECYTDGSLNSGLGGVQFGITYDNNRHSGVDLFSWSLCGSLQFPTPGWPASNSGNLVIWDTLNNCQTTEPGGPGTGVVAAAGYFYLTAYTPDRLQIIPRPVDGLAKIADCRAIETTIEVAGQPRDPSPLGYAQFSGGGLQPGYAPCGGSVIPVLPATWSQIKTLFGH